MAVIRAAINGWAGHIILPKPNCQRQIVAAVEIRKVTRKDFMKFSSLDTPPSGKKFPIYGEAVEKFTY
jgi:L-asparaginase/Glu-tRNA(Gln) amidotransferase subunit D